MAAAAAGLEKVALEKESPRTPEEADRVEEALDAATEKRLVRKLDAWIVPVVMLLYLLSFLDRVNIGNARLYGLEEDLGLTGSQFQTAVSVLFATYIASELPSNLLIKKCRPSRWIAFITTGWGLVATLTGVVQSYGGLLACRLLLGLLEGGLFPGMAVYLTLFYTKRELALRIGYLFVSAALAGACGGLLAFGIGHMDGVAGQRGWRWIMILEGIPTFLLGLACPFLLADSPATARYLTPAERALTAARLARQPGHTASALRFHRRDVRAALASPTVWLFSLAQFGADAMLYGYSTFLPTIIRGISASYSPQLVQALTVPCYAAGALAYLLAARLSDATQRRAAPALAAGCVSVAGYAVLAGAPGVGARYAGCFLVAVGLYVLVGLPLAWLPANCPRYGKRAAATGLQLTVGNCAGVLSSFLYPQAEGPRYVRGHTVTLALVAFACAAYGGLWWHFATANARRARGEEDARVAGMTAEEVDELGDESPRFVYTT